MKRPPKSDGLLELSGKEIQLELHSLPELDVRYMDVEPSDSLADPHRVNDIGFLLVFDPSLAKQFSWWHRNVAHKMVELTVPEHRHRPYESITNRPGIAPTPRSFRPTDMVAIHSRRWWISSYPSSSLFLLAHNLTPNLSKDSNVP